MTYSEQTSQALKKVEAKAVAIPDTTGGASIESKLNINTCTKNPNAAIIKKK